MELFKYIRSFSLPLLLVTCVSIVQCGLIDNVNEAIRSNFYEDIANGVAVPEVATNATNATSTPEALSEKFIKQFMQHGDDDDDGVVLVNEGLDVACRVPASLPACKQHLRKQVSTLHHFGNIYNAPKKCLVYLV